MLDLRLIRSDPEGVRAALARREAGDRSTRSSSSTRAGAAAGAGRASRAERNAAAKAIGEATQRGEDAAAEIAAQTALKRRAGRRRGRAGRARAQVDELLLTIPNIPHPSAPTA